MISVESISPEMMGWLKSAFPQGGEGACTLCLNEARMARMKAMLETEHAEAARLESEVLESLRQGEIISSLPVGKEEPTFGERVADRVAAFGGSWAFIGLFSLVMLVWISANALLASRAVDPYPFILLNLVLSSVAALQAPVIMMSQNRSSQRDRAQAEADYRTNLKAELEVRELHHKIDHLMLHQMERLMEAQRIQIELVEELRRS
jgi:uncharacterized membrane protein